VRPDRVRTTFESAFGQFDLARGGLGGTNRLLAAVNEMAAVEANLANGRIVLHPDYGLEGRSEPLSLAFSKYESARSALQRARDALLSARRNVLWWNQFFMLVAQYHADRLLLGYTMLLQDWKKRSPERRKTEYPAPRTNVGEFLLRLRRGYDAICCAINYRIPTTSQLTDPWLKRVWFEMTLAAYAVGIWLYDYAELFDSAGLDADDKTAPEYVKSLLEFLQKSAQLLGGAAADGGVESWWGGLKGESLESQIRRCREKPTDIDELRIRLELLEHAGKLAAKY
jgi:hypothetical protein